MIGISKSFPGVKALENVDFECLPGEVHALSGENGAGKSTLMKILAGAYPMDSGEIRIDGEPVHIDSPQKAIDLGVGIIYQEFNLAPSMSVAENIFLGREPSALIPGMVSYSKMHEEANEIMQNLGVDINVRAPMNRLSIAMQQITEIAKATSRKCRIIVMDEPSATLTDQDLKSLFTLIRRMKSEGVSIIYISHRMEEIFEICDRVTIMRDGRKITTLLTRDTSREDIIRYMVGRDLAPAEQKEARKHGEVALSLQNINRKGVLHDISMEVRCGEIVGLAGLVGAGRTELARVLFGADPYDSGTIKLFGKTVRIKNPRQAIKRGIGLVTEDRKAQGLVLGMSIRENITMAHPSAISKLGFYLRRKERNAAEKYIQSLRIRTPSVEQSVLNLSGGTQQKVVLSKWLFTESRILIFDEPTRGIDVGAKAEIYQLMEKLAEQGTAIIMISSELPEILLMSDRIFVMHEGAIKGEMTKENASQESIIQLATGGVLN
jgi:ribose transport system ATP-binding protein